MTLRELIAAHPEWADLQIAVYRNDGEYDFVGESGDVYLGSVAEESGEIPVVVFSGN